MEKKVINFILFENVNVGIQKYRSVYLSQREPQKENKVSKIPGKNKKE